MQDVNNWRNCGCSEEGFLRTLCFLCHLSAHLKLLLKKNCTNLTTLIYNCEKNENARQRGSRKEDWRGGGRWQGEASRARSWIKRHTLRRGGPGPMRGQGREKAGVVWKRVEWRVGFWQVQPADKVTFEQMSWRNWRSEHGKFEQKSIPGIGRVRRRELVHVQCLFPKGIDSPLDL